MAPKDEHGAREVEKSDAFSLQTTGFDAAKVSAPRLHLLGERGGPARQLIRVAGRASRRFVLDADP